MNKDLKMYIDAIEYFHPREAIQSIEITNNGCRYTLFNIRQEYVLEVSEETK